MLSRLSGEGKAILLITHDLELVYAYAKRALVLDDGKIVFDGAPATLFADEEKLDRLGMEKPLTCVLAERVKAMKGGRTTVLNGCNAMMAGCKRESGREIVGAVWRDCGDAFRQRSVDTAVYGRACRITVALAGAVPFKTFLMYLAPFSLFAPVFSGSTPFFRGSGGKRYCLRSVR